MYLTKTLSLFKTNTNITEFLNLITKTSSVELSCIRLNLPVRQVLEAIENDEILKASVNSAVSTAISIAEGILYERAVYGYDEEVFDATDNKVKRLRRVANNSLIDFLRANNPKYTSGSSSKKPTKNSDIKLELLNFKENMNKRKKK